jgi:outer membrane protein assembly factor BamB
LNIQDLLHSRVADLAVASGVVYASSASVLIALDPDSGAVIWSRPFVSDSGKESGALVVDSNGAVYFRTGSTLRGVQEKLFAINSDGTLKWEYVGDGGSDGLILSTDESIAYLTQPSQQGPGIRSVKGLSTVSGRVLFESSCDTQGPVYAYSPSNVLYTGYASNNLLTFEPDLRSCSVLASSVNVTDIVSILDSGLLVVETPLPGTGHSYAALDSQGRALWSRVDPLIGGFASRALGEPEAVLYAVAPETNELIALRVDTGAELWRQRFSAPLSGAMFGGDGRLYLVSGTDLLRSVHQPAGSNHKEEFAGTDSLGGSRDLPVSVMFDTDPFFFTLSAGPDVVMMQGQSRETTITATAVSGSSLPVSA